MPKHPIAAEYAPPRASSMIETMRSIGYGLDSALADIVDNSISANARVIHLKLDWNGGEPWLCVCDDGDGMNGADLIEAMRLGGMGPQAERSSSDLGRFGLGMKTASFSQCRRLTVTSRKSGYAVVTKTWDLDWVASTDEWTLVEYPISGVESKWIEEKKMGTIVRWELLDRLSATKDEEKEASKRAFYDRLDKAHWHLEMVFHHFLESGVKILINDSELMPWNPFRTGPRPQPLSEEYCGPGQVRVRPYVLPHHSKYDDRAKFDRAGGPFGWNAHQGFYVYRNNRLLVAGDWFGFFKKDEHLKLARIRIDITSDMDAEWELDIKKSKAQPPAEIKDELRHIAKTVRSEAQQVYRHRGLRQIKKVTEDRLFKVWLEKTRETGRYYQVNRNHPALVELKASLDGEWGGVNKILKLVEESLPITHIVMREAESPDSNAPAFDGFKDNELISLATIIYESLLAQGLTPERAKARILLTEPFNYKPEILENLPS